MGTDKMIFAIFAVFILTMGCEVANSEELTSTSISKPSMLMDKPDGKATSGCESAPESSCKDRGEAFEGQAIPMVPSKNSTPHSAPEELTEDAIEETVQEEAVTPSYMERLWLYLGASRDAAIQRGSTFLERHRILSTYGKINDSDLGVSSILEQEVALREAEAVREQRALDLMVMEQERQVLYQKSLMALALNGYYEARSETADQEVGTAAVVLNRLSVGFRGATTIAEVVYSPSQFSWVKEYGTNIPNLSKKSDKRAWARSLLIAKRMLDPDAVFIDSSNGGLYYYNPNIVDWKYAYAYKQTAVLGNHRFMTEKDVNHKHYIDNSQVRINPVLFNGLTHDERDALKKEFQLKNNR